MTPHVTLTPADFSPSQLSRLLRAVREARERCGLSERFEYDELLDALTAEPAFERTEGVAP